MKRKDVPAQYKFVHYKCVYHNDPTIIYSLFVFVLINIIFKIFNFLNKLASRGQKQKKYIPTTSNGQRPIQAYSASKCPVEIKIVYKVTSKQYEITKLELNHKVNGEPCHDCDEKAFKSHPKQRRLDKADFDTALNKLTTGSDAKKVTLKLKMVK